MQVRLRHRSTGQQQSLCIQDIVVDEHVYSKAYIVYCDPPWSPGCLKWWHTYMGQETRYDYETFLASLCERIARASPRHVFIEQSVNPEHREMFLNAVAVCVSWALPLIETYRVVYGRPRRPNVLLHWGHTPSCMDLSGLYGDNLVQTAFRGVGDLRGRVVYDPCMGKGTTSRAAHKSGASFVGSEMNSRRFDCAIGWLKRHGYSEQ